MKMRLYKFSARDVHTHSCVYYLLVAFLLWEILAFIAKLEADASLDDPDGIG